MRQAVYVLVAGVLIGGFQGVQADIIAAWDVAGVDVGAGTGVDDASFPYTMNATVLDGNIAAGGLTLGFDAPSISADMYGFRFSSATHQTSLADAIVNDHYIQFTVTAAAGYRLNLTSIEMNGQSGSSGPANIALMSDVDGFADGNQIQALSNLQGVTGGWDTDVSGWGTPIDLSGAQYQELDAVTFRIYGWNSTGTASSGIRNLAGNDLVINGTVQAIPEPAVISFITFAAIGILVYRRIGNS